MIPSSGGVFEVMVNDQLVFSKRALKRHAKPGELYPLVSEALPRGDHDAGQRHDVSAGTAA